MSDRAVAQPRICLNMIVRNEAHIVAELLDSVAPYISSWVIVDTGSDDGTQNLITNHMNNLGIPGELCERPWRNFGENRTEAMELARGHGDYIWVMDADDILVGTPDFTGLSADVYELRIEESSFRYWRPQLFRDGAAVRYQGVVHEHVVAENARQERLGGDYHIESRRLGGRNLDGQKYIRDRDLLLAEIDRNPEDTRSVFHLAETYMAMGDFAAARGWFARRVRLGGWDEEVYYSMVRFADAMAKLDVPDLEIQDAYLRAWEFRPTRAEALYAAACRYRAQGRYQLAYLLAKQAAQIPLPESDIFFVFTELYTWRAADEAATCAFHVDKQAEAFTLWRSVLARSDIADTARQHVAGNRDCSVPAMLAAASSYPDELVQRLVADSGAGDVAVSLAVGPDRGTAEQMLNSFLHCCTDLQRIGRFLVADAGLSADDRAELSERYGFLEFVPAPDDGPGSQLRRLREQIRGRFWLHLGRGWRFFAPEDLITRLTAVLQAEPQVIQVAINFTDAAQLTGSCAAEGMVRRTPEAGRYVLTHALASGPAMFDITRLVQAGGFGDTDPDPLAALTNRAAAAGLRTACLDEILCVTST